VYVLKYVLHTIWEEARVQFPAQGTQGRPPLCVCLRRWVLDLDSAAQRLAPPKTRAWSALSFALGCACVSQRVVPRFPIGRLLKLFSVQHRRTLMPPATDRPPLANNDATNTKPRARPEPAPAPAAPVPAPSAWQMRAKPAWQSGDGSYGGHTAPPAPPGTPQGRVNPVFQLLQDSTGTHC
jgi:hypothetical protein